MPSRRLHRSTAALLLGSDDGGEVDRILDSTVAIHGPRHREDRIHSLPGVAVDLALRGQLTPDRIARAGIHIALDEAWSRTWQQARVPSGLKKPMKDLAEEILARSFDRRRRE